VAGRVVVNEAHLIHLESTVPSQHSLIFQSKALVVNLYCVLPAPLWNETTDHR